MRTFARCLAPVTLAIIALVWGRQTHAAEVPAVTLVKDGRPQMPILAGSVRQPVDELQKYVQQISGARLEVVPAKKGTRGVYVGLAADFPWLKIPGAEKLGAQGFLLRTDHARVYVIARQPLGLQHGVTTLLHRLGCRWFFPGEVWESIPRQATISVALDERGEPSFPTQRRIWYGYGAYAKTRADWEAWNQHNRMGGPVDVQIGHTWHGLRPETDFEKHPEWFALTGGKRQPTKPCYSHPEVVRRAIQSALAAAARGSKMISMSPPDGLGYCECEKCRAVFQGAQPHSAHGTLFAERPDGKLVNVTSETLFRFVNQVAAAVAEKYPDVLIGCYAYSAYSHPPSFKLHGNVYLQTTTAFRRTPISLEEQIAQFGEKTRQVGVREYYSVYQSDWDWPDPGKMTPARVRKDLRFFHQRKVSAVNAEASNNWSARGLGYYVAANLLWDIDADVDSLVGEFFRRGFGPAARPVERYYARWYGDELYVWGDKVGPLVDLPRKQPLFEGGEYNLAALRAALVDLDEAARLTNGKPPYRVRVDRLRMYAHYLLLRYRLHRAVKRGDKPGIVEAIGAETVFGGRLADTSMLHARPLIGKAFLRRFRDHEKLLADVPQAQPGGPWRQIREPPSRKELEKLWAADLRELELE